MKNPATREIFATHAIDMVDKHLAVIPVGPKREPHIAGFNNFRRRPGKATVGDWAEQYPSANVGVLPGLCGSGAMVADCDTPEHAHEFQDRFGKSDLHVRTCRGEHLWYGKVGARLPGNLRKFGLDVDIKAGNQVVIAPPSIHETGHVYQLDGCDWGALKKLRDLNVEALCDFAQQTAAKATAPSLPRHPTGLQLRDGSRRLGINDRLYAIAWSCQSEQDMLDAALGLNIEIGRADPRGELVIDEVTQIASAVWEDRMAGKIEKWSGAESGEKRRRLTLTRLCELDSNLAADAYVLFDVLCDEHSARCRRGETFAIAAKPMARAQVIIGWEHRRYERARELLMRAKLIEKVAEHANSAGGRCAAQYKLCFEPMWVGRGGGQV